MQRGHRLMRQPFYQRDLLMTLINLRQEFLNLRYRVLLIRSVSSNRHVFTRDQPEGHHAHDTLRIHSFVAGNQIYVTSELTGDLYKKCNRSVLKSSPLSSWTVISFCVIIISSSGILTFVFGFLLTQFRCDTAQFFQAMIDSGLSDFRIKVLSQIL